ncbi:9829_t:CDS:2 [Dentiscutata erythropus]|uniref:9829_t:CDS:1 n=1 Tax=Dentiscutata erythropus TaxID=1348616 RepID=A0A9N8Z4Y5_9GLOM|nr:9829_t:CDS:2 [Dentiscutata erythropus]
MSLPIITFKDFSDVIGVKNMNMSREDVSKIYLKFVLNEERGVLEESDALEERANKLVYHK